nr:hypothetical protein [Micromonospora sp. DSM 115978]
WAAAQPRRAGGLFAALLGAVVVLVGFSVHDLTSEAVGASRVASHAVLLVGLGLVYLVDRAHQRDAPTPGHPTAEVPGSGSGAGSDADVGAARGSASAPSGRGRAGRGPGLPPLRPANQDRRAA